MPAPLDINPVGPAEPVRRPDRLGDPRQEAFERAVRPLLGKSMQGEVLARLSDNQYLVRIAGTPTRLPLPFAAAPGAGLPLTLVSTDPRPAFEVDQPGTGVRLLVRPDANLAPSSLRAAAGLALPGARTTPPFAPAAPDNDGSPIQLSTMARVLAGVFAAIPDTHAARAAIVTQAPLLADPGAPPHQLASALQGAIGTSGLFYESHVAEWAAGDRSLAALDAEPQQQAARDGVRQAPTDPATAQFISMQLAAQEQAQLAWQGNLWPGQPIQLEVQRDTRDGQPEAGDSEVPWHSRLRLHFPELGELDARLTLTGGRLQVHFSAGSDATAALLRRHMGGLAGALEAAGTRLEHFEVQSAAPGDSAQ